MEEKRDINQKNSIIEFTIEELKQSIDDEEKIVIPTYQRGIAWKKNQQENLIDSLFNHYPFGCLLLYRIKDGKYKIIDGLQRSYTVIDYYDNPLKYFNEKYIPEETITNVTRLVTDEDTKEDIRVKLSNMIKDYVIIKCKTMYELKNIDLSELMINIINEWNCVYDNSENIKSTIQNAIDYFCEKYDFICENLRIPAIIFESPEDKLPEIFERINSEGSKLTKYQIYAATWSDDKVKIESKELSDIILNVKNRYDSYLKDMGTLDGYDSVKITRSKEVNIFDMVYGFGKMICRRYPDLFNYEDDAVKVESVGFNLINACLIQKSSNMRNLNLTIKEYVGYDSQSISSFLSNILECINYVNNKLSRGICFKGNKLQTGYTSFTLHTELQIISIIASLFIIKYMDYNIDDDGNVNDIEFRRECNSNWKKYKKSKFDSNVLKKYAIDLIDSKWRGSGDSKLYNVLTNKTYYTRKIMWKEFETSLDRYFNAQKNERNERIKVANPNNADKLILNLIYSSILSAKDQIDDSGYDIEHLATKGIMKTKIQNFGDSEFSLPISSIGNLCLLPKEYNEKKGEKVLYQFIKYYDKERGVEVKYPISKYERMFTFTKEKDFDWLINEKSQCTDISSFREEYDKFITKRFKLMENRIKRELFPDEMN